MKRYRVWFAVLGVLAIPAAAAACWPMWGRQAYAPRMYSAPMYSGPMYQHPAPVYVSPPTWQRTTPVLPPPRIETIPREATPTPAPAPGMGTAIPEPMPPTVVPVRPASGIDAPPKMTDPLPPPPMETPRDPALAFPKVEIPKNLRPDPKVPPPLELPKEKVPDLKSIPQVPAVGAPKETVIPAIPSAAPPPESLIPPPSVPLVPDPNKRDPLPSLTLPPEIPVAPEKKTDSASRSSPLTGTGKSEFTVTVFPAVSENVPLGRYRTVGFYNHTTTDLALTIEGRAVKLPAKSYLQAQLAVTFTWGHGNRPAVRESVPDGAGGLDVVFRD